MGEPMLLCYHAVSETWEHPMSVHPERLREQLDVLLRRGFRPVTLSQALTRPSGRSVVITFDDGFLSTYSLAFPVLREMGVPGTAFLTTGFLANQQPLAWPGFDPSPLTDKDELLPMSWEQAREMADAGWEFGSHSVSHPRLPELDDLALRRQLVDSRAVITAQLDRSCSTIAYPFGVVDRRVRRSVREAGYEGGVTLGCRPWRRDRLALPRIGVYRSDDSRRFALKVSRPLRSRAGGAALSLATAVGRPAKTP